MRNTIKCENKTIKILKQENRMLYVTHAQKDVTSESQKESADFRTNEYRNH